MSRPARDIPPTVLGDLPPVGDIRPCSVERSLSMLVPPGVWARIEVRADGPEGGERQR